MTARSKKAGAARGRTLVVGDIHGCDVALDTLLSRIAVTAKDTVVVLGDIVDRGPNTKRVIDRLLELQKSCRLIVIRGNHEDMLFLSLASDLVLRVWLDFGGHETLASYGGSCSGIPPEHLEFLRSTKPYWATDSTVFVHASLQPGVPLEQQSSHWLRWARFSGSESPLPDGRRVICGHTAQKTGLPLVWDGWACIDTWVYGAGWLTCLDVETGFYVQAQQRGSCRSGELELWTRSI